MLSKIQELINDLIQKNILYSFLIVYVLATISSVLVMAMFAGELGSFSLEKDSHLDGEFGIEDSVDENIAVEISGAVVSPGVFELKNGSRIVELINTSGGFSKDASEEWISKYINLSNQLEESQKIYIPFKWDDLNKSEDVKVSDVLTLVRPYSENLENVVVTGNNDGQNHGQSGQTSGFLTNINTASQEDIDSLPGIGPVYANKFIENRPYTDLDDLKEKSEVSESVVEKIKELITF